MTEREIRCKDALRQRILQILAERDLTLNALCRICGVTQSTVNNITCGRNNSTRLSTILKICDGLDMTLIDFFDCQLFRNLEQEIV